MSNCRWNGCRSHAKISYRDVRLLDIGLYLGDVHLCKKHLQQARRTGHMDLDQVWMRIREAHNLLHPETVPPLVIYHPPSPKPLPKKSSGDKYPGTPRIRTRRKQANHDRGAWCETDWDSRFDDVHWGKFSTPGDGTAISSTQNISGRKIMPLQVPWIGIGLDD